MLSRNDFKRELFDQAGISSFRRSNKLRQIYTRKAQALWQVFLALGGDPVEWNCQVPLEKPKYWKLLRKVPETKTNGSHAR